MLGLILLSQNADTVKSDGVSREETFRFLAGQCLLGSTAYPTAVFFWVLSISEDEEDDRYASCAACMTPMACLMANGAFALSTNIKKPLAVSSFTGAVDGMIWSFIPPCFSWEFRGGMPRDISRVCRVVRMALTS